MRILAAAFVLPALVWPALAATQRPREKFAAGAENPGVKVGIELNRGGQVSAAPMGTVFRSGDRIKLHLGANFSGHAYVFNVGSTQQRIDVLFPHKGVTSKVTMEGDYAIPGKGWIVFDENPGAEQIKIVLSADPIPDIEQAVTAYMQGATIPLQPQAAVAPQTASGPTSAPAGSGMSARQEEAEILGALNSRSLVARTRDLKLEVDGDEGYAMADQTAAKEPLMLDLVLEHR